MQLSLIPNYVTFKFQLSRNYPQNIHGAVIALRLVARLNYREIEEHIGVSQPSCRLMVGRAVQSTSGFCNVHKDIAHCGGAPQGEWVWVNGARKGKENKEVKPRGRPRKHLVVAERAKAVVKVSK